MNKEQALYVFEEFINNSSKVAFTFDVETKTIGYLSKGFEQLWTYPRERLLSNPASILNTIHAEDKEYLQKEYMETLAGKIREDVEFRMTLPDGGVKWLVANVQLFTDKDGKRSLTGVVDDVTTLKDNISTLQRFAAKKDAILEVLSHDLAGPLGTIKSLSSLLAKYLEDNQNEEIKNIVGIIYQSSVRSIRLIREFIDQEFLESTNPGLIKIRMNLVEKLKEIVDEYVEAENLIKKNIAFKPSSDRIYVYIDHGKFMQVVNNLISNAIKFTPDGGTISLMLKEHKNTVTLTVEDNGIGIPEKYHGELFEKFTKARREGLKGEPTIGLGMSIIKTIVEWHGGKIWFESAENAGTTFIIELPKK